MESSGNLRSKKVPGGRLWWAAKTGCITRPAVVLRANGERLVLTRASAEQLAQEVKASTAKPEGASRFIGNSESAAVIGRNIGGAGSDGGAGSAEEQRNQ